MAWVCPEGRRFGPAGEGRGQVGLFEMEEDRSLLQPPKHGFSGRLLCLDEGGSKTTWCARFHYVQSPIPDGPRMSENHISGREIVFEPT